MIAALLTADPTLAELQRRAALNNTLNVIEVGLLAVVLVLIVWDVAARRAMRRDMLDAVALAKAHSSLARAAVQEVGPAAAHAAEKVDVIETKVEEVRQAVADGGSSARLVPWVPGVSADRRQGDGG